MSEALLQFTFYQLLCRNPQSSLAALVILHLKTCMLSFSTCTRPLRPFGRRLCRVCTSLATHGGCPLCSALALCRFSVLGSYAQKCPSLLMLALVSEEGPIIVWAQFYSLHVYHLC